VFHEDDFTRDQKYGVLKCSDYPVSFHYVDLSFPMEFDADSAYEENRDVALLGTSRYHHKPWGYARMIRFWTTQIWKHSAVQPYDTIMRIDTDSCFVDRLEEDTEDVYFPSIRIRYVYRSDGIRVGVNAFIEYLYDFAMTFMREHHIEPANPELWNMIQDTWNTNRTLPIFSKNFEVSRVSFFQRSMVMKWHDALTDEQPYGVFRYRWSDAQTKVLTMAMFADPDTIYFNKHPGYKHGRGVCRDYFNWMADI